MGCALGLDEGQVWGGCTELVMLGEVVTLGGSAERVKRGRVTAPMALRSDLSVEWSAAGTSGDERGERGSGVEWLIVRFVLSVVGPEWS